MELISKRKSRTKILEDVTRMFSKFNLILAFGMICITGCSPLESTEAPKVGAVTPSGPPEVRDLSPSIETVPNCSGASTITTKHPSYTISTAHSIEWEVGGETGIGFVIGEGALPVGVELDAAFGGSISNGLNNNIENTNAWDLSANPNTIREYTIMWREIWQPGYIDIVFPNNEVIRIEVVYRAGIQSDIIGEKISDCDSSSQATNNEEGYEAQDTATESQSEIQIEPFCAFIEFKYIEDLQLIASVSDAISQTEIFANNRQNNFNTGENIPANVLIATDLKSSNLEQFPITPINNQGGWGLFFSDSEFIAPNDGTYWCIIDSDLSSLPPTPLTSLNNSNNQCFSSDWEKCWSYDHVERTMTWTDSTTDPFNIGQKGMSLERIREGYTAIFSIQSTGSIEICFGSINGQEITGACPMVFELSAGNYQINSSGASGGFRVFNN